MTATPAVAVCKHLRSQNDGQTSCAITGATMPRDCAAPREADADSRSCIPILALLYAQGERAFLATLDRLTRETVMATAANVKRRLDAGLINTRRDRPAEETEPMRAEESRAEPSPGRPVGGKSMAEMTAAELDSLASTARKLARERKKTEKQRARVLPALKAAKELAESRVEALEVAIEEAEAGKAVDLKALRVKISRRVSPTPTTREAIKRTWTPERRAAQRAGALETNAKRRKAKLAK
jgi:hypothetical protein